MGAALLAMISLGGCAARSHDYKPPEKPVKLCPVYQCEHGIYPCMVVAEVQCDNPDRRK
jgi:hypothetical protein